MAGDIVIFTGAQRFCGEARKQGYTVAALQDKNEDLSGREDIDFAISYHRDDMAGLEEAARNAPWRERVAAVFNRRELRTREAGVLNRAFGLSGVTPEQADIVTDKFLLHEVLSASRPDLVPRFELLSPGMKPGLAPPVALKPRNMFKSQLIRLCESEREVIEAVAHFESEAEAVARRHGVRLRDGVLAEEYVRGKECALDSFVDREGRVIHGLFTELIGARARGIDDFHVYARLSPGGFMEEEERAVRAAAEQAIAALGLRNSAAHIDFILSERGPKILEIGARIGGYRSEMAERSFGYSLDQALLDTMVGKEADVKPRFQFHTAVLEFFPERQGVLSDIAGLDRVRKLDSFCRLRLRFQIGDQVGLARHGFRCVVFVVLTNRDRQGLQSDISRCEEVIRVEVE